MDWMSQYPALRGRQDNVNDILDHMFCESPHPLGGYASTMKRVLEKMKP